MFWQDVFHYSLQYRLDKGLREKIKNPTFHFLFLFGSGCPDYGYKMQSIFLQALFLQKRLPAFPAKRHGTRNIVWLKVSAEK
jgi:hypothetical protein